VRALFLTKLAPFPVKGGENIRSYGLIRILSKIFDEIVAIIGKTANEDFRHYNFSNVSFCEFDFKAGSQSKLYKRYRSKFTLNRELITHIELSVKNIAIDVVFIDYDYYGQYIPYFKSRGIPVIYGTHNVQSRLDFQMPAVSVKNSISLFTEYLVNMFHEIYYFRKADALIAVSKPDKRTYARYIRRDRLFVIPNFVDEDEYYLPGITKGDYVIMTGNFIAYQNNVGLHWFLENVWKDKCFKDKRLMLAGISSDISLEEIKKESAPGNVEALGMVDDLRPCIAAAAVSIVPLIHGSGTRLKCIESMALRTQLISTSKGAEGIDHEGSIEIADDPQIFREKLSDILNGRIDHTDKAYEVYRKKYSLAPNLEVFKCILKRIGVLRA